MTAKDGKKYKVNWSQSPDVNLVDWGRLRKVGGGIGGPVGMTLDLA